MSRWSTVVLPIELPSSHKLSSVNRCVVHSECSWDRSRLSSTICIADILEFGVRLERVRQGRRSSPVSNKVVLFVRVTSLYFKILGQWEDAISFPTSETPDFKKKDFG
jgi:hypothetical protein